MTSGEGCAWAQVRQAYEGTELTVLEICQRYKITRYAILQRRMTEGWTIRPKTWTIRPKTWTIRPKTWMAAGRRDENRAVGDVDRTKERPRNAAPSDQMRADGVAYERVVSDQGIKTDSISDSMDKGNVIDRLYRAIETELSIIEDRMSASDDRTPADSERDARSIGLLIRNLEKLTGFDEQVRSGGDKQQSITGITADEADRIRRDLAQRIERLRSS